MYPQETPLIQWFPVALGRLALFHRPGRHAFQQLRALGCSRLVTLLSEREGGRQIGARALAAGMEWTWLPLENGQPPSGEAGQMLARGLCQLTEQVQRGESAVLHCSAGIHRTGMAAYTLLRLAGLTPEASLEAIQAMRQHTFDGLRSNHRAWGEGVVARLREGEAGC